VTNVAFSLDSRHLFTCGDNAAHMWEIGSGKQVKRFDGHTGLVLALALSPDGRRLITAGDDKSIRIWDVATGKELHKLQGHTESISCLAISSDGRRLLSGGMDRTVRLWGLPR
jgi:WD40 repeat protein